MKRIKTTASPPIRRNNLRTDRDRAKINHRNLQINRREYTILRTSSAKGNAQNPLPAPKKRMPKRNLRPKTNKRRTQKMNLKRAFL